MASSLRMAVGLTEGITTSPAECEARAILLCRNRPALHRMTAHMSGDAGARMLKMLRPSPGVLRRRFTGCGVRLDALRLQSLQRVRRPFRARKTARLSLLRPLDHRADGLPSRIRFGQGLSLSRTTGEAGLNDGET